MIGLLRSKMRDLALRSFRALPISPRRIVFSSFDGRTYSDSPKYLYRYLSQHLPGHEFVWALRDPTVQVEGPAKRVRYGSAEHLLLLNTSKYWISNSRLPRGVKKRPGIVHLQTWHGIALKKIGFEVSDPQLRGSNYEADLKAQVDSWDAVLSPEPHTTQVCARAFGLRATQVWETGYPRNDVLFSSSTAERLQEIRAAIGIQDERKLILYAPTWRDDTKVTEGGYRFQQRLDLLRMRQKLGKKCRLLIRRHYHDQGSVGAELSDFVVDVSDYPDIQELYLISDLLLTDYSSSMFDFALLRRPIILFAPDLARYRETRGLYFDLESVAPQAVFETEGPLLEAIERALDVPHSDDQFQGGFERFCRDQDGNSCRRVAERIFPGQLV